MSIQALNLHFAYGKQAVLTGTSLNLQAGQLVFLVGANGSGKSTLLRLLLGQLKPGQGQVCLSGQDIAPLSLRQRAALVSYIPQHHDYSYDFTVADMVLMGRSRFYRWYQRPGREDHKALQKVLDQLGIAALASRLFCSLSGGERQLVLLARALIQQAQVLLMDEVSANLDLHHQLMVMKMAKALSRKGYLVLIATHQLEWAFRYADSLLVMEQGQAACYQQLDGEDLLNQLSRIYACPLERLHLPDGQTLVLPSAEALDIHQKPLIHTE